LEADCAVEGAVGLEFCPALALHFVHFVIALPGEFHGSACTAGKDLAGNAPEDEFASALVLKQDVGGFQHVRKVLDIVRYGHDAPFAQKAHAGTASSFGSRTRL
jgi:hypothetical protein